MKNNTFQWAVIGAGPAGIAAVGKLLDNGIRPADVLWIDPYFKVGDLGRYWHNVSSNTTTELFTHFLHAVQSFAYAKSPIDFDLNHLPKDKTCTLHYIVEPLQWITDHLVKKVKTVQGCINNLELSNRVWSLHSDDKTYHSSNVIVATGSVPLSLNDPEVSVVPFDIAIDKVKLQDYVNPDETYAVFGSSHSAIIIIRYLIEIGVKKVVNFYRSPCQYAINMNDWTLFDNTGLKGQTAEWARQHIDGRWPPNLVRHISDETNKLHHLPFCDKVIYAIGFKQRHMITMGDYEPMHYNPHVGIIGPGLFGLGIAFPEKKQDPFGNEEYQVGLWKFMLYLNKIMPVWFKYHT